jgi:PAS domain S-box-containing protein
MSAPLPLNEAQRLATLREYRILDTIPEQAYDDITLMAAQICDVPTAMVSLVDENRQWFKSRIGMDAAETPRDIAFCAHTILSTDDVMVVGDALADKRFADNPLVAAGPLVRFYAGAPLVAPDGSALGALCVMDQKPRTLDAKQLEALKALGRHAVAQLELRRQTRELASEIAVRQQAEATLRDQYNRLVASERESSRLLHIANRSRSSLLSVLEDEKRAGLSLRESEERFRQLAENISEVFWIKDVASDLFIFVSSAYEEIWGRTRESLYASPSTWLDAVHPEDRVRVSERTATEPVSGSYDEEYRIMRPDGAVRWIRDRGFPVRNDSGEIYRLVGVAENITGRKEMEAQFFRAQRIEGIGMLASGIAHDMNNILAPIMMSAPLLRLGLSPAQTEKTLATIETSAQRGAALVRQLLTFGRGAEGARGIVEAGDLIREVVKMAQQTFPKNIFVTGNAPESTWPLMGDTTQLHQVLLNLVVNARDAMPRGGAITIAAENVRFDRYMASTNPEAKAGPYVVIAVTDTGTGIPPKIIERIFDPFFTTKENGKGTGLGLSTVVGLVKGHGGFVRLLSELGHGTTFQVFLPAAPEVKVDYEEGCAPALQYGHGELILVVDDEEKIREVTRDILIKFGYQVITAGDGASAAMLFAQHLKEIKAVITDVEMPTMDGVMLIRVLKKMNHGVAVLVTSGIANKRDMDKRGAELSALGVRSALSKPYSAETILRAVHDLLDPKETKPADEVPAGVR